MTLYCKLASFFGDRLASLWQEIWRHRPQSLTLPRFCSCEQVPRSIPAVGASRLPGTVWMFVWLLFTNLWVYEPSAVDVCYCVHFMCEKSEDSWLKSQGCKVAESGLNPDSLVPTELTVSHSSYSLKSVTPKRWKVLFGLFLAEELHYARPRYGFNFFVYPYEKRYDSWWYYNGLFSGLWKIPWISVQGDTHDVCCLHSICPVCCMAEGLSILDRIVLPEVLNQGWLRFPGDIWQYLESFLVVTTCVMSCYWHLVSTGWGCY